MDTLWYLKYGEAPKADLILTRMSEAGICLLTGETSDILAIPVNLNTSNMLPTNMVCLSKKIIEDINYTYNYTLKCPNNKLTIIFDSSECFVEYNKSLLSALDISEEVNLKSKDFIEVYELLMSRHVKGIDRLVFDDNDTNMSWTQIQRYWFNKLDKNKNKSLKIVSC